MTAWIMVPCRIVLEGLAITSACVTVEGSAPFSTKSVTSPKVRSVRAVSFAPEAPPKAMVGEAMRRSWKARSSAARRSSSAMRRASSSRRSRSCSRARSSSSVGPTGAGCGRLAQLEASRPQPAPVGPTEDELRAREQERLRREEEARRMAELERRAAEERAFQERRIASPTIAFGGTSGANETALTERTFGEVTDFVLNGALPSTVTQAEVIANPSNTIIQGTMIQAVMETALDSSLPGQTRAVVSEDVYSVDGARLLIPRGSRLIGRYRAGVDIAQRRVTIAWDRIILPAGQTVQISSFGGDELGRSGVTGFVDTRFDERFGSAALISLISAAPSAAASEVQDETAADILEDVGDDLADATDSVIGDYLSIGPVIYVDQGARVTVMVDRDLEIF